MVRKGHPAEMEDRPFGLHAVIIKKSVPAEDAVEMARDIIKKPDFKKRETKASYRFRAIPKTKFVPKMFRSKKINKDITLVFGELKPEFATLSGRGFFDYFKKGYEYVKEKVGNVVESAKDFFSPRLDDYNNKTKEIVKQYGGDTITKATIYRKPVDKWIPQVLNAVSLGKWNQAVKKAGYDKFFHLSLIVVCKGEPLNVEKLDVVSIKANDVPTGDTVETQEVPLENKSFTLFQMLEKARADVGDKAFFEYDSFQNNCQSFVSYLLKGQGLYSEEAKAFVYQPIQQIVDDMPDYVKKFQRGLTDISATFNKISGQGSPDELTVEDIIAFLRKKKSKKAKELLALISTLDKKSKTPFTKETLTGKGWWDSFTRFFTERIPNIAKQVVGAVKSTGERVGQDLKNIFGGAKPELESFLEFLKTKELKKKPTDSQLKKLYKEHTGIKRLQGKGFWDDFKQGFNMVFEPGAKYILKPLATATGALPVVAGLTALGYGKNRLAVMPEEEVEGGASRGANFMKALGASQGKNTSRAKRVWNARHPKEEGDKINESKFGSFDIKKVNKGTQDVIAKTKKMTPDRMIREFHSWLKRNAQLLEPQGRVDGKNQTGLYDLRGLWERFSQERQPAPVAPVAPVAPAPAQEQTIQQLARLYYHQAGLANRRPIKRQMDERFTPEQVKTALATQRQRIKRAKDRERQ
jgi:hypothetical protein